MIGLLIISIWTALSILGLFWFNRRVDVHLRHKDTETVGLTYAIVATVYAVLIALIVVDVFEAFSKSDEIATAEANKLSNLMLDASGLPPDMATETRSDINKYIDVVVKSEWPSQQAGKLDSAVFMPGWKLLAHMDNELAVYEPKTMGQSVDKAEMLRALNELIKSRRSRILAAGEHLPDVVWVILIIGGVISVVYTYLFGARTFPIHVAITGLIAATIALCFVLIITLDYPFRGEVSVSSAAFTDIQATATGVRAAAEQ